MAPKKKNHRKKKYENPRNTDAGDVSTPVGSIKLKQKLQSECPANEGNKCDGVDVTPRGKPGMCTRNLSESKNFNGLSKSLQPTRDSESDDIRKCNTMKRNDIRLPPRPQSESETFTPREQSKQFLQKGSMRVENDSANRKHRNLNMGRTGDRHVASNNCPWDKRSFENVESSGSKGPDICGQQYDRRERLSVALDNQLCTKAKSADVIDGQHLDGDSSIVKCGPPIPAAQVSRPSTVDKGVQSVPIDNKVAYLTVGVDSIGLRSLEPTLSAVIVPVKEDLVARGLATNQWLKCFITALFPLNRAGVNTSVFSDFINHVSRISGIERGFTSSADFVISKIVVDMLKNVFNVLVSITGQFFFILAASEGFHAPDMLANPVDGIEETLDLVADFKAEIELFVNCARFLTENKDIVKIEGFSMLERIFVLQNLVPLLSDFSQGTRDILGKQNITYVLMDPLLRLKYGKPFDTEEVSKILQEELRSREYRSLVLLMDNEERAQCTFEKTTLFVLLDNMNAIANSIDIRVQEAAYKWLTGCLRAFRSDWESIASAFDEKKEVQKWKQFFKNIYALPEKFGLISENPLYTLLTASDKLEEITVDVFLMFLISSYTTSQEELGLLDIAADTFLGLDGNKNKGTVPLSTHQLDYLYKSMGFLPDVIKHSLRIDLQKSGKNCEGTKSLKTCDGPKSLYNCVKCIVNKYAARATEEGLSALSQGVWAMCPLLCPLLILSEILLPLMKHNVSSSPPKQYGHTFVAVLLSHSEFLQKLVFKLRARDDEVKIIEQLVESALSLYEEPKEKIQKIRYKFIGSILKAIDAMLTIIVNEKISTAITEFMRQQLSPVHYRAMIYSFFKNWKSATEKIIIDSLETLSDLSIVEIFKSWPWDMIYIGMDNIFMECFENTTLDKILVGCRLANILANDGLLMSDKKLCKCFHSRLLSVLGELSQASEENVEPDASGIKEEEPNIRTDDHVGEPGVASLQPLEEAEAICPHFPKETEVATISSEFESVLNSDSVPKLIKSILLDMGRSLKEPTIMEICQRFNESSHIEKDHQIGEQFMHSLPDAVEVSKTTIDTPGKSIDFSACGGNRPLYLRVFALIETLDMGKCVLRQKFHSSEGRNHGMFGGEIFPIKNATEEELDSTKHYIESHVPSLIQKCKQWHHFHCTLRGDLEHMHYTKRISLEKEIIKKTGIKISLKPDTVNIEQTTEEISENILHVQDILKPFGFQLKIDRLHQPGDSSESCSRFGNFISEWNTLLGN